MAQEELWLRLKADIGDVKKKLGDITAEGNKTTSALGAGFKKLGVIIAGAFATGAIIKFGATSLKAFAESESSALSLANTLKNVVGLSVEDIKIIEDAVNKLEVATAFDDVEIRNAMKSMLMRTGDINLAIKSLPVAMEMARATGQNLASMMNLLGLGFQGQARGLRQFGINTVEGKTNLEILDMVMGKVRGSMGAFAKTTSGSIADMQTSWGNLKELVGGKVAPVFAGFTTELAVQIGLMIGGISTSEEYANELKNIGGVFAKLIVTVAGAIGVLFKFGMVLGATIELLRTGVTSTARWREELGEILDKEIKIDTSNLDEQLAGLIEQAKSIGEIWKETGKYSPEARERVEDYFNEINKLFQGLTKTRSEAEVLGDSLAKAFRPAWEPITLMGGNLPELSRFIGNLRFAQPVVTKKIILEVNVHDTSRIPTETSRAVAKAVPGAVKGITESHASSFLFRPWR